MMAHINKSIVIEAPVEQVHARAADPERYSSWLVGLSDAEKMKGDGGAGSIIEHSYLMGGARIPLTTEILENWSGPDGAKVRARARGPMDGEHTWTYEPVDGGTRVTVGMEYKVPGAALGKIADRLIVERMQARSFEQSLENLKMLCEAEQAG
jgi:uncharacterized membrane protein